MDREGEIQPVPHGALTDATTGRPADLETEIVGHTAGDAGIGGPAGPDRSEAPEASVDAVDHLLDEVEQALSRLDDGTYGRCASCGEPIDDADLADSPTARECAGCQSQPDG